MRAQRIFLSAGLLLSMLAAYGAASDDGMVMCAYTTGAQSRAGKYKFRIPDIPTEMCSHVSFYGVMIDPNDGHILVFDDEYKEFRSFKPRFPGTTLVTTVLISHEARKKLESKRFRQVFISELETFLDDYRFDVVTIAYVQMEESLAADEDVDTLTLMVDIKKAFAKSRVPRKIFIHPDNDKAVMQRYFNKTAICNLADNVFIDVSDLRNSKNNFVDVPSPMRRRPHDVANFANFNVEDITQSFLDAGCAPQKLILTVGFTGLLFKLGSASHTTVGSHSVGTLPRQSMSNNEGSQAYFEFCRHIDEPDWTSGWDPIGAGAYIYSKRRWIGYENERSLEEKVRFVKEKRLAGIAVFSIDLDDYVGQCGKKYPLLSTVSKSMRQ